MFSIEMLHVYVSHTDIHTRSRLLPLTHMHACTHTHTHTHTYTQFVGGAGQSAFIIEESIVDSSARTFTTYTRNINFAKLLSIEEKCVYYSCPDNDTW